MTFAPPTIQRAMDYWVKQGGTNSGIVGDTAHQATGTSYHLGKDELAPGAYSAVLPRDKAGLSNAASAMDLGSLDASLKNLQEFSVWLVNQAKSHPGAYGDIREIIYSPDGVAVRHWNALYPDQLFVGGDGTGHGDNTHRWHTHISFYRDSEFREKVQLFSPYFDTMGDIVNSFSIPKVPTIGDIPKGKTIWPNDAMDPNDPQRIVVSPTRVGVPLHGYYPYGGRLIEYVDDKGVHTGKAYFIKAVDFVNVRPVPQPAADDGYTQETQNAAVAEQAAADQAALKAANTAAAEATTKLATAATDERERIAIAIGQQEAERVRST